MHWSDEGVVTGTGGKVKRRVRVTEKFRNHEKKKYFFLFALCLSPNVFKFYFQGD